MTTVSSLSRDRVRQPMLAILLAGGLAVALSGCAAKVNPLETTGSVPDDYRINHPIAVEEQVETMDVPVGLYTGHLSDGAKGNINGFARKFQASGSSVIAVVAPSGSPNQQVAATIAVEIEDVLRQSGVPSTAIDYRVYHAGSGERNAPVRVAFSRIGAHTAPCGPWPDQATVTNQNRHYFNFGCASQQNLAAVVQNPLDLLYPRGMTPADAERRAEVLDKYRKGQAFTADVSKEQGGAVATGVGQ
jgi:pilus assembly protein CpaD